MKHARAIEVDDGRPVDPFDSTEVLINRTREGDERARNRLSERYWSALRQWAHGRIPNRARDLVDTDDLVQSALQRAIDHLGSFESQGHGAFLGYARQILLNRIRDECRRAARRPEHLELHDNLVADDISPLEQTIQRDRLERYEQALAALNPTQREAVIMRLELGFRYREIAEAMALPSGNAARQLTARGIVHLTRAMRG